MSDNVDYSQRTADDPEDDWCYRTAKNMIHGLMKDPQFKYQAWIHDPEQVNERIESQAEAFRQSFDENGRLDGGRSKQTRRKTAQPEEEEKPFSSDKFWNSDEPSKVMPKKL